MLFPKQNQILTRKWLLMLESICIKAPRSRASVVRMCLELFRRAKRRLKAGARTRTPELGPVVIVKVLLEGLMLLNLIQLLC